MDRSRHPLHDAFLEDHRALIQGLVRVRDALRAGDGERASAEADALDRVAGPHMAFEERVFYPFLAKRLGVEFVAELFEEHRAGQEAIRRLVTVRWVGKLPREERSRLLTQIEIALSHARSCGTLLSHVDYLDEPARDALLERLLDARRLGGRWSGLRSPKTETAAAVGRR